jgi:predicted AAA+ superfamily ATPase
MLPPAVPREPDWGRSFAFRWRKRAAVRRRSYLQPVMHASTITLDDLHTSAAEGADRAEHAPVRAGRPANNVLLTGARGTGKSSLIKACLNGSPTRACA